MTSVLKPGILVSLKTSVRGGVAYARRDLEKDAETAKWETTKTVENPAEHEAATKTRNSAAAAIRRTCAQTAFGLLCAAENEKTLDEAVREAKALCATFNAAASTCQVDVWVLKGRIASTDEEATRAIASEIQTLLEDMESGIKRVDVEAIRDAASRAKKLEAVLSEDDAAKVTAAVDASRRAARAITQRVKKEGEDAVLVLKELKPDLSIVSGARFAFLDLTEDAPEAEGARMPVAEVKRFAGLELDHEEPAEGEAPPAAEGDDGDNNTAAA